MTEAAIRRIVQEEIQRNAGASRFGLKEISHHTHNGIDSLPTFQPTITYIGMIGLTGTIAILPTGWTCAYQPTGIYQITHNLNSLLYVVVTSPLGLTGVVDVNAALNLIEFDWFTTDGNNTAQNTPFYFTLTLANNKSAGAPTYQSTVFTQTGVLT
jgi:hypothetical protein